MERLWCWSLVEVEIASENLVSPLTRQHHLDTHALDDTGKQVHRGAGPDGCHVVCLNEVNDITDSVKPLLNGVVNLVVYGTDVISNELRLCQVGCTLKSHGKGVEAWPPGLRLSVLLNSVLGKFLCYGRYHR